MFERSGQGCVFGGRGEIIQQRLVGPGNFVTEVKLGNDRSLNQQLGRQDCAGEGQSSKCYEEGISRIGSPLLYSGPGRLSLRMSPRLLAFVMISELRQSDSAFPVDWRTSVEVELSHSRWNHMSLRRSSYCGTTVNKVFDSEKVLTAWRVRRPSINHFKHNGCYFEKLFFIHSRMNKRLWKINTFLIQG